MENKINIAEILRECPPGMELNCTMYDNVRLKYVSVFTDEDYPICIETKSGFDTKLTKYGQNVNLDDAKCVIFPKGKTTWEGFVPYQFKDGDIIVGKDSNCSYIAIFESFKNIEDFNYHVILTNFGSFKITGVANNANLRFATEEEKQKLFDVLKENGYYWDKRIKTVKALIIRPKFKDGDIVASVNGVCIGITTGGEIGKFMPTYCVIQCDGRFEAYLDTKETWQFYRLATEEEKQKLFDAIEKNGYKWNAETKTLEKLVEPKFKVGDIIQDKYGYRVRIEITEVNIDEEYYGYTSKISRETEGILLFKHQDAWEELQDDWKLVPEKFDINTLVPFESKVLVRNTRDDIWRPAIFGCYIDKTSPYYVLGGIYWKQCIPFEGNEHLLGKIEDCDEFYKNW